MEQTPTNPSPQMEAEGSARGSLPGFRIVAAATDRQLGIGLAGAMPWRLPKEMAHFAALTTNTSDPRKRNAVVMGRVTFQSIPSRFRPLKGRLNIVLTTKEKSPDVDATSNDDAIYCDTLESALAAAASRDTIESVFVIGGQSVYALAMGHPCCRGIHLTRIVAPEFECDRFFPKIPSATFAMESCAHPVTVEGDVHYVYENYVRK